MQALKDFRKQIQILLEFMFLSYLSDRCLCWKRNVTNSKVSTPCFVAQQPCHFSDMKGSTSFGAFSCRKWFLSSEVVGAMQKERETEGAGEPLLAHSSGARDGWGWAR